MQPIKASAGAFLALNATFEAFLCHDGTPLQTRLALFSPLDQSTGTRRKAGRRPEPRRERGFGVRLRDAAPVPGKRPDDRESPEAAHRGSTWSSARSPTRRRDRTRSTPTTTSRGASRWCGPGLPRPGSAPPCRASRCPSSCGSSGSRPAARTTSPTSLMTRPLPGLVPDVPGDRDEVDPPDVIRARFHREPPVLILGNDAVSPARFTIEFLEVANAGVSQGLSMSLYLRDSGASQPLDAPAPPPGDDGTQRLVIIDRNPFLVARVMPRRSRASPGPTALGRSRSGRRRTSGALGAERGERRLSLDAPSAGRRRGVREAQGLGGRGQERPCRSGSGRPQASPSWPRPC